MKTSNAIKINKSASEVWKVLALDFDKAGDWMAAVPKSHRINEGDIVSDSPMVGRVCEFTSKSNGPKADERITHYDETNKQMTVVVKPINAPFPINKNTLNIGVKALNENQSEVIWETDVDLKFMGYLMYPLLKMGLKKNFNEILQELKYYVENGTPHPRKLAKNK